MKSNLIIALLIGVLGFGAVIGLSSFLEKNRVNLPESYEDEDLALQGKRLKSYALGSEGMLSDWYWMRALQYIGGKIVRRDLEKLNIEDLTELNPRLLYPLLDISTDLDPKSMAPFSYGATVLPAISSEQAIALTRKGIENNPENWRLYQYLGYIYWRLKDYEKAGQTYDAGAEIPGAPPFFRAMAARIRTESGSRELAREIYKQAVAEAPDESTKAASLLRLKQLDSLDERDAIDAALAEYRERSGSCARRWSDILPRLAHVRLPHDLEFRINEQNELVDPSGAPYLLDPAECKAKIDPAKSDIALQ
jgi:tetratricopeptide (TPR) repeat protein